jgi:hypothetical protein
VAARLWKRSCNCTLRLRILQSRTTSATRDHIPNPKPTTTLNLEADTLHPQPFTHTQIVGKLRYSLTAGDVFGGPAVSSKVGPSPADTMVSHPGTVIASVDRLAWKAAFGTKHRVFSYQPHRIRKMLARCHSSRPEYSKIDSDVAKLEDVADKGAGERPASGAGEGVVERAVLGIADRSASGTGAGADRTVSGTIERMGSVDEGGGGGFESSTKVDKNLVKELCKGLQFFAQVPYENLERIQDRISLVRVPQGDSLCTQGSTCQGVFIILSGVGSVRESKHRSDSPADDAFLSIQVRNIQFLAQNFLLETGPCVRPPNWSSIVRNRVLIAWIRPPIRSSIGLALCGTGCLLLGFARGNLAAC